MIWNGIIFFIRGFVFYKEGCFVNELFMFIFFLIYNLVLVMVDLVNKGVFRWFYFGCMMMGWSYIYLCREIFLID